MALPGNYQKYMQQSVTSLTPGEQIILLFRHAAGNIAKAVHSIEEGDSCGAHNAIIKAQNIYSYLSDNLDMRFAMSESLFSLYAYAYEQLVQANLKKDADILRQVLEMTRSFGETWEQAEKKSRAQ